MRVGTGAWIQRAAELSKRVAGLPAAERRRFLEQEHARGAGAPQTLHREMIAWRYVLTVAKSLGVSETAIVASCSAVEALARLEKTNPEQAAAIGKDVLLGIRTTREITRLAELAREPEDVWDRTGQPGDWAVYAMETCSALFLGRKGEIKFAPLKDSYSAMGQITKVDMEFIFQDAFIGLFISPESFFSRHFGKSIHDQVPRIYMALFFFDEVYFVKYREEEGELLERFKKSERYASDRLKIVDRCY